MTKRQSEPLDYIKKYISEHKYSPSYEEMMKGIGVNSKSNIHQKIHCLVKLNLITIKHNMARSIEVI